VQYLGVKKLSGGLQVKVFGRSTAKELGLDERKFSDCLISKKFKAQIEQWINDAQTAKIEGTPTFFINDEEVIGNQPYEVFSQTIDKFLKE